MFQKLAFAFFYFVLPLIKAKTPLY